MTLLPRSPNERPLHVGPKNSNPGRKTLLLNLLAYVLPAFLWATGRAGGSETFPTGLVLQYAGQFCIRLDGIAARSARDLQRSSQRLPGPGQVILVADQTPRIKGKNAYQNNSAMP